MKVLHHGLWLLALVILQPIINSLSIFEITPCTFMLFGLLTGLLCGRIQGLACGFVFGLVYDLFIGRFVGVNAFIFMLLGYVGGVLSDRVYSLPYFLTLGVFVICATVLSEICYYIIYSMEYPGTGFWFTVYRTILPCCIYNTVVGLIMWKLMTKTLKLCRIKTVLKGSL